ncbi:MAG: thiamine phosphate synthase [Gemmatimonadaceae bacterium]
MILARSGFLDGAKLVMHALGARGAIHLRAKSVTAARIYDIATLLAPVQDVTGCWLVINERIDLARATLARGVQLTSRSMRVADARRIAPTLALGASVHAIAEATAAEREGADWIAAGHVFATASHAGVEPRGLDFLRRVAACVRIPCLAIGGVTPERVATLVAAGAYGVAAIGGIWGAADAARAATDYLSAYDAVDRHA